MSLSAALLVLLAVSAQADDSPPDVADDEIALLVEALDHKDANIRQRAVIALGERGADSEAAVPRLVKMLAAGNWRARDDAFSVSERGGGPIILALAEIGPPAVPVLAEALAHEDKDVSQGAALALCRMRPVPKEALPIFTKKLDSDEPLTRRLGAYCMQYLGESAAPATSALVNALSDEDKDVRGSAIMALRNIGPKASEAVPHLVDLLRDNPGDLRVIVALGGMGPAAAPAIPELVASLNLESDTHRQRAALAIGEIGPAASIVVPELVKLLGDPSLSVRMEAANSLGKIGPPAKAAIPALNKHLEVLKLIGEEGWGWERRAIENALRQIAADK